MRDPPEVPPMQLELDMLDDDPETFDCVTKPSATRMSERSDLLPLYD